MQRFIKSTYFIPVLSAVLLLALAADAGSARAQQENAPSNRTEQLRSRYEVEAARGEQELRVQMRRQADLAAGAETELIENGGFEAGEDAWEFSSPALINDGAYPRSGLWYAIMGENNEAYDQLEQNVPIPEEAESVSFSFWYNITSDGSDGDDNMVVSLEEPDGEPLTLLDTYSGSEADPGPGNPHYEEATFDVSDYAGQTVRVEFLTTTDESVPTTFRVDDVSFTAETSGDGGGVAEQDSLALVALYNSTDGQGWENSEGWLEAPVPEWHGVAVGGGRVIQLILSDNQLSGPIPPEFGKLTGLRSLGLRGNQLSGSLPPELRKLASLEQAVLAENNLSGEIPPELGQLERLRKLTLQDNQLSGPIPPELSQLGNLESLILAKNNISGEIPSELGRLSSLRLLSLSESPLSGPIPPELGQLTNLKVLDLDQNQLSGKIPPELGKLENLQRSLSLSYNQLSGSIPSELRQLANLQELFLGVNQLSGPIPSSLGQMANLRNLDIGANNINGEIPVELAQLERLQRLLINDSKLTGTIPPELSQLSNLEYLGLNGNELQGAVPSELSQLSNLETLYLNGNALTGAVPSSFSNLTAMSEARRGLFWFNDTNLCEPTDEAFQAWLDDVENVSSTGETCSGGSALSITSVEPDPVPGSNAPQPLTINGSGFTSSSEVTLRDKRTGEVFPDREISEQTSTAITINPTFTTKAATWTVEVSNPDGGSSGEYEFEVVSPTVARYPSLSLSTASLAEGESLTITGRDFTAGGSVSLRVAGPPGFETDQSTLTASSEGAVSTSFSPGSEAPAGKYAVSARDVEQDEATSSHTFRVEASPSEEPASALEVTAPAEGQELQAGTQVQVRWTDRMTPGSSYPREGASRGYRYDLEISDGGSWTSLGPAEGFRSIGETVSFQATFQLPSIQSENARIRVTDQYQTDRQAESGVFTVQSPPPSAENLETELFWDYSFTRRPGSAPVGVAADGVARLYLVAKKENAGQGPAIERVDVSVATASGNTEKRLTGTLMPAEVTDRYSTEANGADARSVSSNRSRSGAGNEFWFWYVAPKDFKERERDLSRSTRMVDASFTVEYADGTTVEDVEQQIEITRPPLMLVHGLGGSPSSWNNLTYREDRNGDGNTEKTLLKNSRFFLEKETIGISPDGSFKSNSELLLTDNFFSDSDGFSDILGRMRQRLGFAANQVYYVGHSMGGAVARQLIGTGGTSISGIPYHKRKNYGQGYVDRLITLDTPHSGSPLADFTEDEIVPSFGGQFGLNVGQLIAGSFLDPFVERKGLQRGLVFDETDAVADLVVGPTFPETHVPSHLIAGDVMGKQNRLDLLARPESERFLKVWNLIFDATQIVNPLSSGKGPGELVLEGIEVATGLGSDGDFVVPTTSQLSGLGRDDPATSVFNVTHFDKLPRSVMERVEVGTRVFELLNEPVGGEQFTSSIPPSPDIDVPNVQSQLGPGPRASLQSNLSKSTGQSKSAGQTIDIEASVPEASVATDSTLTLRVNAPDTTGLRYLRVYFQSTTRLITEKDSTYELSLPVSGSAVDSQAVSVVASYRRPDTSALATDQAMVDIVPASSIQRLKVEPQVMSLREEQARRPDYEAVFEQSIAELGPGSENLTASVEDPSVVTFNADTKSFRGEGAGETAATISYRGKTDVLYFTVSGKTDTTREEPSSGLQVAAGQTGTFELGTTGAEVTISENGDSDGGQLQFARRENTVSTDAFEGSATAPDGSTISPNTASSRYWEITGEDLTDVSFKVRLDTAGIGGIDDPGRLLVLKREDSGSPWTPLNTTREGGTLVSSTLGSFSEFAIGGNTSSNPLPVELSSLDAVVEEEQVTVTWTTASETGNARFQIQRKAERGRWTTVGSVEGAGTTSESRSYRFTDEDLPYAAERLTYRLRQVDTDGTTTLSDPVVVKQGVDKIELLATVPNPASRQARVRFSIPERQEVQLRLYDALGREVRAVVNAEREGRHEETIDVSGLPSGTYFIRLKAGSKTRTQRLTIVR